MGFGKEEFERRCKKICDRWYVTKHNTELGPVLEVWEKPYLGGNPYRVKVVQNREATNDDLVWLDQGHRIRKRNEQVEFIKKANEEEKKRRDSQKRTFSNTLDQVAVDARSIFKKVDDEVCGTGYKLKAATQ